jgi:tRNA U34 5-carboxymethylaminomethyl modifying GTPase MnmE/TrmE
MDNPLIKTLHGFESEFAELSKTESKILLLRDELIKKLNTDVLTEQKISRNNPLSQVAIEITNALRDAINEWSNSWEQSSVMRELSDTYNDRIIILVFGKVNAGKSSFSNFLADCFAREEIKYFYLDKGQIKYSSDQFAEGVTETTACVQGIELGKKLVLLDSPGLHSVTDENGDQTRLFTDSADLILWLSPSTSPGQVQELADLKAELDSNKPLLPVITRSDLYCEDIDDNDEIIKVLENKTQENRVLQEEDVFKRAGQTIKNNDLLKKPISISVHYYRSNNSCDAAFEASGLAKLLNSIASTVKEASVYKRNKAKQQVINYLENDVLASLNNNVIPQLNKFNNLINDQTNQLNVYKREVLQELLLELAVLIPDWAEQYKNTKSTKKLAQEIELYIDKELKTRIELLIKQFINHVEPIAFSIADNDLGEYKNKEIKYQETRGSASRAASGGVGGILGVVIGTAIGGPIGAAIGGVIGGYAGDAAGSYFEETITKTDVIGISAEQVANTTLNKTEELLPDIIDIAFKNWEQLLASLTSFSRDFEGYVHEFETNLQSQKRTLKK